MSVPVVGKANGSAFQAALAGSSAHPDVTGVVRYRNLDRQRDFAVELHGADALRHQTLTVIVNGKVLGEATVCSAGSASLKRSTRRGQAPPTIAPGAIVHVTTAVGVVVASGRFKTTGTR